jgi:hypothetical protein
MAYIKSTKEIPVVKKETVEVKVELPDNLKDLFYENRKETFNADIASGYAGRAIHVYNDDGSIKGILSWYPSADMTRKLK